MIEPPAGEWGILGHNWAVRSLEHAIQSGRAAHAFLLAGPHGIGKTTLARALARRLQCTGSNPPCGRCPACIKAAKGAHPDIRLIEGVPTGWKFDKDGMAVPARKNDRERRYLKVEQIRNDLIPWLATAPYEGRFKLAILRRFEDANDEAANAFLKTLEEPPSHAVLILTAQDVSLVLPTIASRCQLLSLRPLAVETVQDALIQRWGVERAQAELLARLSGGRLGWAVRAAGEPALLEARRAAQETLQALLQRGRAERLVQAGELSSAADELPQLFEFWLTWWRDVLLLQSRDTARVTNVDYMRALQEQASVLSLAAVEAALASTRRAARQLQQNANARLTTEVLLLSWPRIPT